MFAWTSETPEKMPSHDIHGFSLCQGLKLKVMFGSWLLFLLYLELLCASSFALDQSCSEASAKVRYEILCYLVLAASSTYHVFVGSL